MSSTGYIAPELLRFEPPTPASDVFSLGIVLYEMTRGRLAWRAANGQCLIDLVEAINLSPFFNFHPPLKSVKDSKRIYFC